MGHCKVQSSVSSGLLEIAGEAHPCVWSVLCLAGNPQTSKLISHLWLSVFLLEGVSATPVPFSSLIKIHKAHFSSVSLSSLLWRKRFPEQFFWPANLNRVCC